MPTDCSSDLFGFTPVERRRVEAGFDGGAMTSDAGALLLGATEKAIGLLDRLVDCFDDRRCPELIEHSVPTMLGQRIFGIALGYEDLSDHDQLRHDPMFAVLAGKLEATRSNCAPIAGKSTLNRLELSRSEPTEYHKIAHDPAAIEHLFVDLLLEAWEKAPSRITLDLDATDDPLHGIQEGRFYHGCYCYLPLYIFAGRHLLVAKLRQANIDGSAGALEELERVVARIKQRWPKTRILLRADSGFARDELMTWCEQNGVDYLFGLARNTRLQEEIVLEMAEAKATSLANGGAPARVFKEFLWRTRNSWSRQRRVVAKAEWTHDKANPRFVVTNLKFAARALYEVAYCGRGEIENRIKQCQLEMFADPTSTRTMAANQLRLWFSSFAYVLLAALRRIGLQDTCLAKATCGTIRQKLLKIGALVTISVRRIKITMASAYPWQQPFAMAHERLTNAA